MKYEIRTEGDVEKIIADSYDDAVAQAETWLRDGDWDMSGGTIWVHGYLESEDGAGEYITVQIDPDEPECIEAEHVWRAPFDLVGGCKEAPGVQSSGGGVTTQEVCMHCGCGRFIDTWAQDPETGKEGLTSVQYEPGKYAEMLSAAVDPEVNP